MAKEKDSFIVNKKELSPVTVAEVTPSTGFKAYEDSTLQVVKTDLPNGMTRLEFLGSITADSGTIALSDGDNVVELATIPLDFAPKEYKHMGLDCDGNGDTVQMARGYLQNDGKIWLRLRGATTTYVTLQGVSIVF